MNDDVSGGVNDELVFVHDFFADLNVFVIAPNLECIDFLPFVSVPSLLLVIIGIGVKDLTLMFLFFVESSLVDLCLSKLIIGGVDVFKERFKECDFNCCCC